MEGDGTRSLVPGRIEFLCPTPFDSPPPACDSASLERSRPYPTEGRGRVQGRSASHRWQGSADPEPADRPDVAASAHGTRPGDPLLASNTGNEAADSLFCVLDVGSTDRHGQAGRPP